MRKGLISYNKTNGIISLKNMWMQIIFLLHNMFEKEENYLLKSIEERQLQRKEQTHLHGQSLNFFLWRMCDIKNF